MRHIAPFALFEQLATGIECQSVFSFLFGNMEFEQHVNHAVVFSTLFLYFLEQFERIHRFYHRHIRSDIFHLVGLQMSDEMPLYIVGQHLHLLSELLLMAFAKHALSFFVGSLKILHGVVLADSHQTHSFGQS